MQKPEVEEKKRIADLQVADGVDDTTEMVIFEEQFIKTVKK